MEFQHFATLFLALAILFGLVWMVLSAKRGRKLTAQILRNYTIHTTSNEGGDWYVGLCGDLPEISHLPRGQINVRFNFARHPHSVHGSVGNGQCEHVMDG
jgi:hypothetical protein